MEFILLPWCGVEVSDFDVGLIIEMGSQVYGFEGKALQFLLQSALT
jgi:hypothetical protein